MDNHMPDSVLFVCNYNSVRSPMAECIAKSLCGDRIFIDSIGICKDLLKVNPFAISVMEETGLDLSAHKPKHFEDLHDTSIDLIICLSEEAKETMSELTRGNDTKIELWNTEDPSGVKGSRENIMTAFREVAEELKGKIEQRLCS
ncbi:arsenate reductase ArsC [Pseudemcibacter aquimaris]|uniref:arsenate reductase ArsC n=1 Tax=Pseudemcibacter aquimaris TaxID=2857064 RepID=UPI0020134BF7|nr:arsenate reductase ArsC [Pseudemcibacter aquimaris]MCC3861164.1 arsenate reductase ArsC [Pseudemcibacter aquimaris]WDU57939.1 arsenate reductase ArsC [Pseudemcibacter aquimaris]